MRVKVILFCLTAFLAACSSSGVDGSVQTEISQRAKQTVLNLMVDINQAFDDIDAGRQPYARPSNPLAHVYVYDLDLNVVAHPDPAERGTSHKQRVDDHRRPYPQQILERALARKKGTEGWIEYTERGLHRLAFYERAQGRDGYYYVVVSTAPVGGSLSGE